jgi:hypothetical protein
MPHPRSKKPKATAEKASPGPPVKLRKRRLPEASLAPEQAKQSIFAIGDPVSHPQFGDAVTLFGWGSRRSSASVLPFFF